MGQLFASNQQIDQSPSVYAVLAGVASNHAGEMENYQQYTNLISDLDAQDPLSLSYEALRGLYDECVDDAIGGFLLGLMEVRCNLSNFSTIPGMYCPDPEGLRFVGDRLIEGFSHAFMEELDYINQMSASADDLLVLASCADDEFSRGYCIAIMSIRAQLCMIHPQFGDGLAINTAMESIPGLFAMKPSQSGPSTLVI